MAVSDACQQKVITLFRDREYVAGNGTPSELPCDCQTSALIGWAQHPSLGYREIRSPANWMLTTVFALDRIIRIIRGRKSQLSGRACASAAAAGVHRSDRSGPVCQNQALSRLNRLGSKTRRRRRCAEELTVRG